MSPHVRNWTIGAVALFAIGVYVITSNVDPNAGLNRQAVKPAAKPAPAPVVLPANPPVATKPNPIAPGVVNTFEGGAFGKTSSKTQTPSFTVDHDWTVEIETKGEFSRIGVSPDDIPPQPEPKTPEESFNRLNEIMNAVRDREMDVFDPPKAFKKDFAAGGKYVVWFSGNGVWKVTVRQGAGKLP